MSDSASVKMTGALLFSSPKRTRVKCRALVVAFSIATASPGVASALPARLGLIPSPVSVRVVPECSLDANAVAPGLDRLPATLAGAADLIRERWARLGNDRHRRVLRRSIAISTDRAIPAQGYALSVRHDGIRIRASDTAGAFYALVTVGQLARPAAAGSLFVPCVDIVDAPALRWRILSDDVSRGPLPTMRYFEERIRTIAAFKMNGYSPYMEHVFVDPEHPLPAPFDGISPGQLHELAAYAARFHVAFVPEQQTFAHMHETLKFERYAALAELPHGYLLTPANVAGESYARDLIAGELAQVPHPPFFHIGSDEPSDLGRGAAAGIVATQGDGPVYARHVGETARFVIAHGGARPMIWDDALARHPELFASVPKQLVFINWHYGSEPTYQPYIDRIARGGFEQMVAPGALNWNEIYPDLDGALRNIDRFVSEGKASHVLGLFQTVWHDDGETLFEATWYPVVYAAASAWARPSVEGSRYASDFPRAFFGTDDARFARDVADLAQCRTLLRENPREYGDYLFWTDPFAPDLAQLSDETLVRVRLAAEDAMQHLRTVSPPLHASAASVMLLAARRYDALGRNLQIAREARTYYEAARTLSASNDPYRYRDLNVAKYLFWEMRDTMFGLQAAHRAAWEYEDRPSHEQSVLERYRIAADRAIVRADRLSDASIALDKRATALPPFDDLMHLP